MLFRSQHWPTAYLGVYDLGATNYNHDAQPWYDAIGKLKTGGVLTRLNFFAPDFYIAADLEAYEARMARRQQDIVFLKSIRNRKNQKIYGCLTTRRLDTMTTIPDADVHVICQDILGVGAEGFTIWTEDNYYLRRAMQLPYDPSEAVELQKYADAAAAEIPGGLSDHVEVDRWVRDNYRRFEAAIRSV